MPIFNKNKKELELGFGSTSYHKGVRFINTDGSVNVRRKSAGILKNLDIYHWFITISFPHLMLVILSGYIAINLLFASIYYAIGIEHFGGVQPGDPLQNFLTLVFFSAQTLTTVGYGHIHPVGALAGTVSSLESLAGLMGFALATGILYGRFSRPKADLLYSRNILIAPYRGKSALMFRIANRMQYELIECEARVTFSFNNPESGKREFLQLKLELNRVNFLPLSWTIVHPLDEESPISTWSLKEYRERDAEVIILIKAINDTFSQNVFSRFSYKSDALVGKAKFRPLKQEAGKNGRIVISVNDIHEYEMVE